MRGQGFPLRSSMPIPPICGSACGYGRCSSTIPSTTSPCCATNPPTSDSLHLRPNDLRLQIRVETGFAGLVAPAGLLVAAEGHGVVELHLTVQPDGSGLEPLGNSVCAAQVLGPGGGRQPVGAVVGQGD